MEYIINDNAMLEQIIEDLEDHRNLSNYESTLWAKEHGDAIVSAMWDEYSLYLENNAPYQDKKDD